MKVIIAAIGKMKKNSHEFELVQEYIRKSKMDIQVVEAEEKRALSGEALKKAESELLLRAIPKGTRTIVLDEKGVLLSSRELADILKNWQDQGAQNICFLIGGADGHSADLKNKADLKLSFGRMTLPHMLMRVVLAEQIYRAGSILANHPYHRD
ncbi:MAG: 23S rRNA (pseudouridine(1915)-N(3))-methyltransferase RlmH [Lactobacillales bacterium]|jgi:23S rRNA (pseudouridine1915-N3)-methyltransferase|nr:23S rRNA (pseudouridine(1915)-N(3))-methyltransferase RlmH [Lactobacillales bacterium]